MTEPLDLEKLRSFAIPEARDEYDPRDAILYALGTGAGLSREIDETSLLFEREIQILPTMALVLGTPGFWPMDPSTGLDWANILHGEQRLVIHSPLDIYGTLIGKTTVTDVADKGSGKAALIRAKKDLTTLSGLKIAETTEVWVARGAGGFGGERNLPHEPLPRVPSRDPDYEIDLPTSPAQAAIYRLSGDRNPLHIDPITARRAGFDRPILHGLSTMGLIGRALIHAACGSITRNLREIALRFVAPVYPGDTIRTHIWRENGKLQFQAISINQGTCVVDNGLAVIGPVGV